MHGDFFFILQVSDETYHGLTQNAYLPNTPQGRQVLIDLKRAFDLGLLFSLSGAGNITLGRIPLKPQIKGGTDRYTSLSHIYLFSEAINILLIASLYFYLIHSGHLSVLKNPIA